MTPDATPSTRLWPSSSSRRWTAVAAVAIAGATIAAVVLSLLIWLARGMADMPVSFGSSPVGVLGLVISPICYAAIGGILASRLPANPIGWLFLGTAAALGMMLPVNVLVAAAHESVQPAGSWLIWIAFVRTVFGTPVVLTAAAVAVLLFPDGRPIGTRWWAVVWLSAGAGLLLMAAAAFDPVGLITYPSLPNPLALPYALKGVVDLVRIAATLALVSCGGLALVTLWKRYRGGDSELRAQLRWIVAAVAFVIAAAAPFVVARYVIIVPEFVGEVLAAVAQIGAVAFPLAAAFAMSRYRLFDIDVLIGRSLVYLPLMAVLGGMYTAGIALAQRAWIAVTGSESELAVVFTILVVASAFTPVRKGLEAMVEGRFAGGDAGSPRHHVPPAAAFASTPLHAPPQRLQLLGVDREDRVACPLSENRRLRDCLGCSYLVGIVNEPGLSVVCSAASR